jgi:hypothetical protein
MCERRLRWFSNNSTSTTYLNGHEGKRLAEKLTWHIRGRNNFVDCWCFPCPVLFCVRDHINFERRAAVVWTSCRCVQWGKNFNRRSIHFLHTNSQLLIIPIRAHTIYDTHLLSCLCCMYFGWCVHNIMKIQQIYLVFIMRRLESSWMRQILQSYSECTLIHHYWIETDAMKSFLYLINSYIRGWRKYPIHCWASIDMSCASGIVVIVLLVHLTPLTIYFCFFLLFSWAEPNGLLQTPHIIIVGRMFNGQITILNSGGWIPYEFNPIKHDQ